MLELLIDCISTYIEPQKHTQEHNKHYIVPVETSKQVPPLPH